MRYWSGEAALHGGSRDAGTVDLDGFSAHLRNALRDALPVSPHPVLLDRRTRHACGRSVLTGEQWTLPIPWPGGGTR